MTVSPIAGLLLNFSPHDIIGPHSSFITFWGLYDIFGPGEAGHLIFGEQIDIDGY